MSDAGSDTSVATTVMDPIVIDDTMDQSTAVPSQELPISQDNTGFESPIAQRQEIITSPIPFERLAEMEQEYNRQQEAAAWEDRRDTVYHATQALEKFDRLHAQWVRRWPDGKNPFTDRTISPEDALTYNEIKQGKNLWFDLHGLDVKEILANYFLNQLSAP